MEALKKLEQELQCAICLDTFTDPKLLICGHVFCGGCLPKLVYPQDSLACPTCRKVTPYPEDGVKGLQAAFRVNSLIEIQQSLKFDLSSSSLEEKKESATTSPASSLPDIYCCTEHPKQELKLYCEKCGKLVCIECVVDGAEHHTHNPVMLEKTCDRLKVEIRASLEPVKMQITSIASALSEIGTSSEEIAQQQETIEAEIQNTARKFHQALDAKTTELIGQLHQRTQAKLKGLSAQRDEIETTLVKYQQCEATIEDRLNSGSDVEIVTTKESIMEKIESIASSIQPELLKPNAFASLEFTSRDATSSCMGLGTLSDNDMLPDPSKCFIIFKDLESLEVGQKGSVLVQTMDCNSEQYEGDIQLVECEFVSELTGTKSVISFERQEKSLYELSFTPTVKGMHQLIIKINSQHVAGSPVTVPVQQSIEKSCSKISTITDIVKPWGVAISREGKIIVSEKSKHRVSIFSPQGQKLRSFGMEGSEEGQFKKPCGVAVDRNGDIFVADSKNRRIQKFTADGEFLKAVGTKGKGDLQFEKLRGLAFNTVNNNIYVIDGNRIKILDPQLSFISSFDRFNSKDKTFHMPVSIACDSSGQLYVADCMNNRIVVLTPEGEFLKALGKFHLTKQTFNHPVGVAVDNDGLIYLSQLINGHNRVSVVTPEGNLVKELDGGSGIEWGTIYTPIGLTVDASGVLYVCEFNSNRVALY